MKLRTSREQGGKKTKSEGKKFHGKTQIECEYKKLKNKEKSEEGNRKQESKTNSHVESVKWGKKIAAVGAWSQVLKLWSHIPTSRVILKTYTLKTWPQAKLRGIDLLQDPIDPKELVSSLRTKASCFGVVIPRPTRVNLVAGLPPQDPSNWALEHGPRPRLKTWPWPTLVMTTFCGWWIDNWPLFPLLNT